MEELNNIKEDFIVNIDGKDCVAFKNQNLLSLARDNGFYIPTLCDLPKLKPVGACRMCVVEDEKGNIFASCKSNINKNLKIFTNTKKLQEYRRNIMSLLCINHPLECGVCDKSGECELQDKVLFSKVSQEEFFANQKPQDFIHFTNKIYDESLCIVCERCARTCNEFVGNNVLSVLQGGYKSKIGINFDKYCQDCDECVSVCPTGAMISTRFMYKSNAWELEKMKSSCANCSLGCALAYEIKTNNKTTFLNKQIYRVSTDFHTLQLCDSGRHKFLEEALSPNTTQSSLEHALEIINNSKAFRLGSNTTNEEALIIQNIAKAKGLDIYSFGAKKYKDFIGNLKFFKNDIELITPNEALNSSAILIFGINLYDLLPVLSSDIFKKMNFNDLKTVFINPISESRFNYTLELKHEVGGELAIICILLSFYYEHLSQELKSFLDNLDLGNLIAESNVSTSEIESLKDILELNKSISILISSSIFANKDSNLIAYLLFALQGVSGILIAPICCNNEIGIANICDLKEDDFSQEGVIGIRQAGEFIFADSLKADILLPSPSQIEATFISTNKELVKLSSSLPYEGIDLSSISSYIFKSSSNYLYSYTSLLPFNDILYDGLDFKTPLLGLDEFYLESLPDLKQEILLEEGSGAFIYNTQRSGNLLYDSPTLLISNQFCIAKGLFSFLDKEIEILIDSKILKVNLIKKDHLSGMVAILSLPITKNEIFLAEGIYIDFLRNLND